jgi:hypothetical protein
MKHYGLAYGSNTRSRSTLIRVLSFFAIACSNLVSSSATACQAYRSDPVFLEDLQKDDFLTRVFPRASQLNPDALQKARLLAQQRSPNQIGELALLEGLWRQSLGAPLPFAITVPSPFTVPIDASSYPVTDPVKIEFDAEGDGKVEWVQEENVKTARYSYTYPQAGEYASAVRIYDRSGTIHIYITHLRILSQTAYEAEFQAVWNDLKESLRRNDISGALECIHTQSRARYMEAFEGIPDLPRKVEEIFSPIQLFEHRPGETLYRMVYTKDGKRWSNEVRFIRDFDGVWRVRAF